MSHVQGPSDYMDSSDINPDARLPVELLHQIVSSVVADYLDDIIIGSQAWGSQPHEAAASQGPTDDADVGASAHNEVAVSTYSDETLEVKNPIIALMKASVQLRATTLEILSSVLGIKLVDYGNIQRLETKPWPYIQYVRYLCFCPDSDQLLRLQHGLSKEVLSSGFFIVYMALGMHTHKLAQFKAKMENATLEYKYQTFQSIREAMDKLPTNAHYMLAGPRLIKNEIASCKAYERVLAWSIEMAEFIVYRTYVDICAYLFSITCTLQGDMQMCLDNEVFLGITTQNLQSLNEWYTRLSSAIVITHVHASVGVGSLFQASEYATPNQVAFARETFQNIKQHRPFMGLNYDHCEAAAQKMLDWLDRI